MTKLLERAVQAARTLPPEMQDEIARILLTFTGEEESVYEMSPEEEASLATARAQVARGEFASDEQMRAIWAKYKP